MEKQNQLSVAVSMSRKVNLGNYESADVFISISGVTADTTSEEMDTLLNAQGALAYSKCVSVLKERVAGLVQK